MADELKATTLIKYTKNGQVLRYPRLHDSPVKRVDVSGGQPTRRSQSIGTASAEVITGAGVDVGGFIRIKNQDTTNFVDMYQGGTIVGKLFAGDVAQFRTGADFATFEMQADTAPVVVTITWLDP